VTRRPNFAANHREQLMEYLMTMTNVAAKAALALIAAVGAQVSFANHSPNHHDAPAAVVSPAAAAMSDGEVRKVDKDQGKVTMRHGPIANLDMPAMTMVFKVADPKMLDTVKEGDKVKFTADRVNGAITVTAIEVAK
jgi:Cu/Ag efflux protein CusF